MAIKMPPNNIYVYMEFIMKKKILLVLCAFMSLSVFAAEKFKKGDTVYVSTKTSSLKSGSGAFASNVDTVSYGDVLKVISVKGSKAEVEKQSGKRTKGWIATGSLTKKKIVATGSKVTASAEELALAGKGFSEEAENAYKAANANLDFGAVDAIEAIVISDSDMKSFIKEGHLAGGDEE